MTDREEELRDLLDKRISKTKLYSFEEVRELLEQGKQQRDKELLKVLDLFNDKEPYSGLVVKFEIMNRLNIKKELEVGK